MTKGDFEHLYERAATALRQSSPNDDLARERLVQAIRAEAARMPSASPGARLPWWAALAAAAIAFAVGLGAGRASISGSAGSPTASRSVAGVVDSGQRPVEFIFVAPSARNVSLVGDFNGWDAAITPMQRMDGRTTWSVAVRLPPGRHVYAFVVDGDSWVADPQAPLAPEQWFGQRNSVVVVAAGDRRL